MAEREEVFDFTVPHGHVKTNPQIDALVFPDAVITGFEVVIPDGVLGLAGFQLRYGGQQVIPRTAGAFFIGNDEVIRRQVSGLPTGRSWQAFGFNTDINDHTFQIRFQVDELPRRDEANAVAPVPVE